MYILNPTVAGLSYPPLLRIPSTPRRVFAGGGRRGCIKFAPPPGLLEKEEAEQYGDDDYDCDDGTSSKRMSNEMKDKRAREHTDKKTEREWRKRNEGEPINEMQ